MTPRFLRGTVLTVETFMSTINTNDLFAVRTRSVLSELESGGQLKQFQTIEGPMGATVKPSVVPKMRLLSA